MAMILPFTCAPHSDATGAGIAAGMLHPISGADHLLAMLSVGAVSAIMGGRSIWLVPLAFIVGMLSGGVCGMKGIAFPYPEAGIAVSIVVLGLAVALMRRGYPAAITFAFVFSFGMFHGNAHGLEMPGMADPAYYTAGFLLSTVTIHVIGIFLAELLSGSKYRNQLLSIAGYSIALAGAYLLARVSWKAYGK